ncbi:MAG TPA: MCE family protein [Acidimicrobiales bacterium]|nr:MCE family protein [Acidimicrobiales bacterium]
MSLTLLLATAALSASLGACGGGGTTVTVTFDDAGDLQRRGSVQVADVRVGTIAKIALTKDFKAHVTMKLDSERRIPRNSVAVLRTTSLLGEKFVELRPEGDPAQAPYLRDGDVIAVAEEAPELEFVAEQAISVLGGVVAGDVATLVETGAVGFGGRRDELRSLVEDLATFSSALAARTTSITRIIDNFDVTTATLADGAPAIGTLLTNLAETTRVLADNRDRTVRALGQLTRLAAVQNDVFDRYRADIERQIKQVDRIVGAVAGQTKEVGLLVDWLARFVTAIPLVIPDDFTQVYMWLVPAEQDPRVGTP